MLQQEQIFLIVCSENHRGGGARKRERRHAVCTHELD
jgi:hypothetical protein